MKPHLLKGNGKTTDESRSRAPLYSSIAFQPFSPDRATSVPALLNNPSNGFSASRCRFIHGKGELLCGYRKPLAGVHASAQLGAL